MSVKMQMSMHILQMPLIELDQYIAEELASNPTLEDGTLEKTAENIADGSVFSDENRPQIKDAADIEFDWLDNDNVWFSDFFDRGKINESIEKHNYQETLITKSGTLREELLQQMRMLCSGEKLMKIAEQIIGNLDENGYLAAPLEEIARDSGVSPEEVIQVLEIVQSLEPAGIAARDLKECLLLQLDRRGCADGPEALIIKDFLPQLAAKKYADIAKALKISPEQVKKYAKRIAQLDPKPCRGFSEAAIRIIPDVILEKNPEGYEVIINTKNLPRLSISKLYKKLIKEKNCSKETLAYLKEKLKNAENLINGLTQREETLRQVALSIIDRQQPFLEKGLSSLSPLTLRQIAEVLKLHPSTISRTVANKYIQTPFGTFPLKRFFTQAVVTERGTLSNQKIKSTLEFLIKTEPADKPLSDQELVGKLTEKGMKVSRRTVTKYRNELKLPAAHLRKR